MAAVLSFVLAPLAPPAAALDAGPPVGLESTEQLSDIAKRERDAALLSPKDLAGLREGLGAGLPNIVGDLNSSPYSKAVQMGDTLVENSKKLRQERLKKDAEIEANFDKMSKNEQLKFKRVQRDREIVNAISVEDGNKMRMPMDIATASRKKKRTSAPKEKAKPSDTEADLDSKGATEARPAGLLEALGLK